MALAAPVQIRVAGESWTRSGFMVTVQISSNPIRSSSSFSSCGPKQHKWARQICLGEWCSGGFGGYSDSVPGSRDWQRLPKIEDHKLMKLSMLIPWPKVVVLGAGEVVKFRQCSIFRRRWRLDPAVLDLGYTQRQEQLIGGGGLS